MNLGSIQNTQFQNPTEVFDTLKGLPYAANSGIYDGTVVTAMAGTKKVNGVEQPCARIGFRVTTQEGDAQLWVSLDFSGDYAYHLQHLALLCHCIDQQGNLVINEQQEQKKDGTVMVVYPNLVGKKLKVAVRRSGEADSGQPFINLVALLGLDGRTAPEAINNQPATWINTNQKRLIPEGYPLFHAEPKKSEPKTAAAGYGAQQSYGQPQQQYGQQQTYGQTQQTYGQAQQSYGQPQQQPVSGYGYGA